MKKILIFLLILLTCGLFISLNYNSSDAYQSNLEMNEIKVSSYQNTSIVYPSWSNGEFLRTYTQNGQLLLFPYENNGSWISQIYEFDTVFLYDIITICYASSEISLTVYMNFGGGGWVPSGVPLNFTLNNFLNGQWQIFFMLNLTFITLQPILFNFTVNYFDDITEISNPFTLSNGYYELILLLILFLFLIFIYIRIKSLSLMTIVYLFFLIISITFFYDLTIPFYPFIQLFFISVGSYLFIDLILDYKKQERRD